MSRSFELIDVFGSAEFSGNPLAVVHDAGALTESEMLTMTRWLNLSETAFLVPPRDERADYRVRIFTLRGELPFAGHPTLGSCHAWLSAGGAPRGEVIVQECGLGLVNLKKDGDLSFQAPPLVRSGPVEEDYVNEIASVLGIGREEILAAEWVDNGPNWVGILLESSAVVLALEPDIGRYAGSEILDIGVVAPHPDSSDVDFEVRAFFQDDRGGLLEDPVTGSLNASLAQWLIGSGRAPGSFTAAQGTAIGRRGRVRITSDEAGIWVGGATVTQVKGQVG